MEKVAGALTYAHEKGIIHRDVKPGNILLSSEGKVKVADFGLARLMPGAGSEEAFSLTRENQALGTPFYMAPEQRNDPTSVDQRADVYSLGIVLYEMLTGKLPELDYEPPSDVANVSSGFNDLIQQATARDPERRLASAEAFASTLEQVSSNEAKPPPVPSTLTMTSAPPKKSRAPVLGLATLAFIGGFVLVFVGAIIATYVLPKVYVGRVQLQINHNPEDIKIFDQGWAPGGAFLSPQFIETQFKIISSKETLRRVANDLNLNQRWLLTARKTYLRLKDNLHTTSERGTDIINIDYRDPDPSMAAGIANSIAENYMKRRRDDELKRGQNALKTLKAEISKQKDMVEAARLKMLDLQRSYNIVDIGAMSPHLRSDETVVGLGTLYQSAMGDSYSTEAAIKQLKNQIEILEGLSGDQLIRSAVGL
ncbi:MAG: protein kinase, partial [Verrucomicrobiota bacterium]